MNSTNIDHCGFGAMEASDFQELSNLRELLGIDSDLPYTVLVFAQIRIRRLMSELDKK